MVVIVVIVIFVVVFLVVDILFINNLCSSYFEWNERKIKLQKKNAQK